MKKMLASNPWVKKMTSNMDEIDSTLAHLIREDKLRLLSGETPLERSTRLIKEEYEPSLGQFVENYGDEFKKEAMDIFKNLNAKNADESFEKLFSTVKDNDLEALKIYRKAFNNALDETRKIKPNQVVAELGTYERILNVPRAYFSNPDDSIRHTRIGTAVGVVTLIIVNIYKRIKSHNS